MKPLTSSMPVPAATIIADASRIPPGAGIYGIYFNSESALLARSGYLTFDAAQPHRQGGYDLLYVGASQNNLRGRVLAHLKGDTRTSSLRMSLGVILVDDLDLDPVGDRRRSYFGFGDGEQRLSDWIAENAAVTFAAAGDPFTEERRLLQSLSLPLNIAERMRHPFSKHLLNLRAYYAGRPDMERKRLPLMRVMRKQH